MAWTYDPTDLDVLGATGRKNVVRLIIGDTNTNMQLLQNEEINYYLTVASDNVRTAAIDCVKAIIAKLARDVDQWMGHTRIELSQQVRAYRQLLDNLINDEAADKTVSILFSPEGYQDKADRDAETDRIAPSFKLGQDDIV